MARIKVIVPRRAQTPASLAGVVFMASQRTAIAAGTRKVIGKAPGGICRQVSGVTGQMPPSGRVISGTVPRTYTARAKASVGITAS